MQLELLAPARNADIGIAAIDCGADAVYIAGPSFGARRDAGNGIGDIAALVRYAHVFSAKIYVVVNTVLFDGEIDRAREMMRSLAAVGVDAFIVQDLGILKMDIPHIPLYASTQTVIRTPEDAVRLERLGFRRLILERQLSLEQIAAIRKAVSLELEFFIHGALCVSYSGQCYLSQRLTGRSANRGACIQACRSTYDLVDADGKVLLRNRSILSLKDYRLDHRIGELVQAGISSFKIEGRLKNASYVKNVVRHYSLALDAFIASHPEHSRLSCGRPRGGFVPDVEATFSRGYTDCFIDGRRGQWNSSDSAKGMGEFLGRVSSVIGSRIALETGREVNAGDGLAFAVREDEVIGMRVESVENGLIRLKETASIRKGMKVYRNFNSRLERELEKNMPVRLMDATINCFCRDGRARFEAVAENGTSAVVEPDETAQEARNAESAQRSLVSQLGKSAGHYSFSLGRIDADKPYFRTAASLNAIRRELAARLEERTLAREVPRVDPDYRPEGLLKGRTPDYRANCANALSRKVYEEMGAMGVDPAYEISRPDGVEVMRSKYCIKYELGFCPKRNPAATCREPLFLENVGYRLKLSFDCKNCEMIVIL